ncbi:MAG: hypothetical protein B0D92_01395 [Spirochaeta sp. LUC14_002_19_P3]|nr:MAG: hypothetical protein B0D92_01395 [Spirochaeta sp. LUC14_002_19_P3]
MNTLKISSLLLDAGLWPLIVLLVINLTFRKYGKAAAVKRMASLYHAIAVFIITSLAALIVKWQLTDLYLGLGTVLVIGIMVVFRKQVFPYQRTCAACSAQLDLKTIYYMDDNLCPRCREERSGTEEHP